ncbi:MAG TPA: DUF6320 domain-containing protein [Arachnia sp.]|nr:DUF6320 domain-containing protein [Arachnia sp.]HMT85170.1 DUF6320 domain-containing protein [Arachnia sp.]
MRRCVECSVTIEGDWGRCPLCAGTVAGRASPSPLPAIPLRFSRRRVLRVLFLASIAVILISFGAQLLLDRDPAGIGLFRSIWLGVTAMWLVVLMAVRKRRNVAKGTVYLVVLVGLVCVYWDYLTGWPGWSLDYAVPLVCASSIVALQIAVRVMSIEVGEHILYSALTVLLGLTPIVFLALGWVSTPLPSVVCAVLALFGLVSLASHAAAMRHELAKRLHL